MKPYPEACGRNRDPIPAVLREVSADGRKVLEIGSGSGQHVVHFAAGLPHLAWQPSDLAEHVPGIRLRCEEAERPNLLAPMALDLNQEPWPHVRVDAVFTRSLHIISWPEVPRLVDRIGEMLPPGGVLAVYGSLPMVAAIRPRAMRVSTCPCGTRIRERYSGLPRTLTFWPVLRGSCSCAMSACRRPIDLWSGVVLARSKAYGLPQRAHRQGSKGSQGKRRQNNTRGGESAKYGSWSRPRFPANQRCPFP